MLWGGFGSACPRVERRVPFPESVSVARSPSCYSLPLLHDFPSVTGFPGSAMWKLEVILESLCHVHVEIRTVLPYLGLVCMTSAMFLATSLYVSDIAGAVSTSRRALKGAKIPEGDFTTLPNGLKYYDLKVGNGAEAVKGSRVAVHYVAKWKGITFMTSRQGLGVGGGTPYGFDVGESEKGNVLKGLDLGVQGMRVGGQRLLIVPPQLAYGSKGVQEIPPNAIIELDVELLSIKQSPFGTSVKIIEG
ncbi:unnamed protein product [Spirodela intermedia]|uniref:peptidylprolyl isomerase n=1 Tax=Spirodela intermedia TaxID=51605 RepID=A0A7I8JKB4_SPIIN|nr:unnamed protein product [Spirodela intermedia]CAA6670033.1 unnamed protein product [Spirodela intermedia]